MEGWVLSLFCLGQFVRAPDDMDNVAGILPLEGNKMHLILLMHFMKSKACKSCEAAVILTGVPTV